MGVIGEAVVVLRPTAAGFGAASAKAIDKEVAGQDVFGSVSRSAKRTASSVEQDFGRTSTLIGDSMEKGTSRISGLFDKLGSSAGSLGLPFSRSLGQIGSKIDETDTKGQHFLQTMSTLGGATLAVGAVGLGAIAAESVHLASGLQEADAVIAGHENISTRAAANIGKAFTDTTATTIYSANEQAEAFGPVSGVLAQLQGHALGVTQSLGFMTTAGDLAEATNTNLASATETLANVMQGFQVPLKGADDLSNQLFNTSRITGVGLDELGGVIERLKARLGVATPTVADLSSLLVDLNEHGVKGSRGLLVVNTAITTLLNSIPKVDAATAKAANTLENKVTTASAAAQKATESLSSAQQAAAVKVADAQRNLTDVQDRIAASATAGAPTTSQQIELQNAQIAVQKAQTAAATQVASAQDKVSASTSKLSSLQSQAGTSTNLQVQAMEQLGLRVYNANGTFIGMRDIISQLQPKLAGMTQEQQLATTAQIFGQSSAKALLATVLAGPSAYDKAQEAITKSSSAHKAATIQNETLRRELEIVKATLIDEGDKLGLFLIPKVEDLARGTADAVKWAEKHKTIMEILAGVIGGVATLAVGTFAINMGTKFVGSVAKAGRSVSDLSLKVLDKLGIIDRKTEETEGVQKTNSEQFQSAADQISEAIDLASRNIVYALGQIDASLESFTTNVQSSATDVDTSFSGITTSVTSSTAEASGALDGLVTSTTDSGLAIIESNQRVAASYSEVGAAAVAGAGEAEGAQAGLAAKSTVTGAETEAGALAGAGGGAGKLAGVGGVGGVLTAATAGFAAFTATTALLKSNTLGLGTAVQSVADHVANFFGVNTNTNPKTAPLNTALLTKADIPYLQQIVSGQVKSRDVSVAVAKQALEAMHAPLVATQNTLAGQKKDSSTMTAKLSTVAQLQQQAYLATMAHGANSSQAKAALQSLYSTEAKYLPQISTNESTKSVDRQLFLTTAALGQLKAQQSKLASEGTIAQTRDQITQLKGTLATQKAGGASETTLKDTKSSIARAESHLKDLKGVNAKISRDETTIKTGNEQKAEIGKVNGQMQQLRQEIATMPPPKIQSKLTGKFRVTAK